MYIARHTIWMLFQLLLFLTGTNAQQGFGAPVYWQHFGISPKGDAVTGPSLPAGRTTLLYSSAPCPPAGAYTIIKRVPTGSCFDDEWIPLSHDQTGTWDMKHAEGNLMLVNNTVSNTVRILYVDTIQQALCPGVDYFFSAAVINTDRPVTCPGSHFFPRLAFTLLTESSQVLATDTIRNGISFASSFMGYKFSEFGVWLSMPAISGRLVLRIDLLSTFYDCAEDFAIDDIRLRPKGAEINIGFPGEPGNTVKAACYEQQPSLAISGIVNPFYMNPALQWQVSTDSGSTWTDIPGAVGAVLTQSYTVPDTFYYRLSAAESAMIVNPACRSVSNKLRVEIQGPPTGFTISSNSPVCSGKPLLFKAEGAAGYVWNGPNGFYDNVPDPSVYYSSLADSGMYYVTVSTWGGCTAKDSLRVKIIGTDVHAWPDTAVCAGSIFSLRASKGSSYLWNGDGITGSATVQYPQIRPQKNGRYTVWVTDASGCSDTASVFVTLRNRVPVKAVMDFPPFLCRSYDSLLFREKSLGILKAWHWDFGNGISADEQKTAIQFFTITGSQNAYMSRLAVTDTAGCTDTAYQLIKVEDNCYIAVPTAFTPNNDGLNDYLYPLNAFKVTDLHFRVYDRKGQVVFESRDGSRKWDGRLGGTEQTTGVYIWTLAYTEVSGRKVYRKGTTVLLR